MAQVLPTDESFAAHDWLTPGSGTTECPSHFFWYLGFEPQLGINASTYSTYPMRSDGPLLNTGRSQIYRPNVGQGVGIPALMTEMIPGALPLYQRGVLCRAEDSFNSDDIDVTITFAMQEAVGGTLGAAKSGGRSGSGPTGQPGVIYPGAPDTRAATPPFVDTKTRPLRRGKWSPGPTRPRPRPGNTVTPDILYAAWLGNAIFLRAGGGVPQVTNSTAANNTSFVSQVDHYAFMAYPVVNSGTSKVDLYLELWQVKHTAAAPTTTGNVPRLLIQQVVDGGAEGLVVSQAYFLRAKCENTGSDVDFNCYIGKWKNAAGVEYAERQAFKDDEFANNTYTVGTNVTHTAASGNVRDAHADKITAYADKTIGWSMGRDRSIDVQDALFESAPHMMAVMEGLYAVEVVKPTTSNTLYRDEFSRAYQGSPPNGVGNPIFDTLANAGSQENGLFSFDFGAVSDFIGSVQGEYGDAGPQEIKRLMLWTDGQADITSPNDFVTLDYDVDGTGGDSFPADVARSFIHARPSTKFYNHHRSVEFKPGADNPGGGTPTWSSNKFEFGILLRGSFSGWTTSGTGCYLHWETDGDGTITIVHLIIANRNHIYSDVQPQSKDTFIASRTWSSVSDVALWNSGGAFDLYDGNFKKLDFSAESYAASTSPSSAAIYHVEIGGSPIELNNTLASTISSPFQSSTTTPYPVVEPGPTSIGGKAEGFWFQADGGEYTTTGTQRWLPTQVRNWTEEALSEDPVSIDPDLQPSIAVAGEGTPTGSLNTSSGALGISGSGVWEVETVVTVEHFRPIRRVPFESGHVYTSPIYSSVRRRWRVLVNSAPLDVCQALQSFYNSHDGPETPFSFVVPITDSNDAQETVSAWFSSDKLDVAEVGPQVYNIAFSVTELLVT